MRKSAVATLLLFTLLVSLCACSNRGTSTFSIQFIDVGQGDAALVACDGHYMLIDGGDTTAGDKVYNVLLEKGIQKLDILAISHMHKDHIGGLVKALTYATSIGLTIANSTESSSEVFRKVEHQLAINGTSIKVPNIGAKYKLGSAIVEVVDVASAKENDSLVLMITYGKTHFLFPGDIEDDAQTRISDKYQNDKDEVFKINVMKIPHHGSGSDDIGNSTGSLYRFVRTFMPDYAVISVGKENSYGHPHGKVLGLLKDADVKVFRTDVNGDIIVRSDGEHVSVTTSK